MGDRGGVFFETQCSCLRCIAMNVFGVRSPGAYVRDSFMNGGHDDSLNVCVHMCVCVCVCVFALGPALMS